MKIGFDFDRLKTGSDLGSMGEDAAHASLLSAVSLRDKTPFGSLRSNTSVPTSCLSCMCHLHVLLRRGRFSSDPTPNPRAVRLADVMEGSLGRLMLKRGCKPCNG